jgi:hypothetical protein
MVIVSAGLALGYQIHPRGNIAVDVMILGKPHLLIVRC